MNSQTFLKMEIFDGVIDLFLHCKKTEVHCIFFEDKFIFIYAERQLQEIKG